MKISPFSSMLLFTFKMRESVNEPNISILRLKLSVKSSSNGRAENFISSLTDNWKSQFPIQCSISYFSRALQRLPNATVWYHWSRFHEKFRKYQFFLSRRFDLSLLAVRATRAVENETDRMLVAGIIDKLCVAISKLQKIPPPNWDICTVGDEKLQTPCSAQLTLPFSLTLDYLLTDMCCSQIRERDLECIVMWKCRERKLLGEWSFWSSCAIK